jgi:hypothetical protein
MSLGTKFGFFYYLVCNESLKLKLLVSRWDDQSSKIDAAPLSLSDYFSQSQW